MAESYRNLDFGLSEVKNDTWVHQRLQAMLSLEKADRFQFATELTWGRMWGKKGDLAPPDQDDPDLLQGFIKSDFQLTSATHLTVQLGRQDLYYGSGRLLASREGANQRLAHDAIRLSFLHDDAVKIDAFLASPVQISPGAFDNSSDPSGIRFWGIYGTFPIGENQILDAYYIGLRDEDSIFTSPGNHETRHTIGSRFSRDGDGLICNSEFIYQFGKANGHHLSAGAASLGIGWHFEDAIWSPSMILRADAISGGNETGSRHTFNPLFQANNYFNEGGFISPSNLYNLNPVLILKPNREVSINMGMNFQWRFDADDAVYGAPLQEIGGKSPGGDTYLGTAYNFSIEWAAAQKTSLFFGYTHHQAGKSLTSIGGGNVDYWQLSFRREF